MAEEAGHRQERRAVRHTIKLNCSSEDERQIEES